MRVSCIKDKNAFINKYSIEYWINNFIILLIKFKIIEYFVF